VKKREMNANEPFLTIGDLMLDRRTQQVWRGNEVIDLPGLSYRMFDTLARYWPEPVPRRDLVREVWGETIVSDDTVRQRVCLLRNALGQREYIASAKGLGYRLTSMASSGFSIGSLAWPGGKWRGWSIVVVLITGILVATGMEWSHWLKHLAKHAF